MAEITRFLTTTAAIAVENAVRYGLFAGVAWLLAYKLFRARWAHRKVVPAMPPAACVRRELRWSLCTLVVFGLVGSTTWLMVRAGWTRMYFGDPFAAPVWFVASIVLTIVLHDTWFYWSHRLLHHPRWFHVWHRTHHLSHNPSPWAAYSFDPPEAVVQAMIFPLSVMLIPLHPLAFVVFMVWQILFNVLGHTGHEYHPRWLMDSWVGRVLNTPTHHAMHHELFRGNYGLYFNVWDRLMGTNHRDYEARFREVTGRPRGAVVEDGEERQAVR
ncbi:MAG: sterol desaturase family protein [Planctomycetes bacterium]|jgi:sterol desaturase/sphingolipid hydroxylase (fatty acid hydroxylase superfamily)|nr:sterol desaturase family protein [Planctomycetota bacterium]